MCDVLFDPTIQYDHITPNGKGLSPYFVCPTMGYLACFIEVHNLSETSEPSGTIHSCSTL
jgi:hypothetical protein